MDVEEVLFALKEDEITSCRFYLLVPGDPSMLAKPHAAIRLLLGASSPDEQPATAAGRGLSGRRHATLRHRER
ncbi:hypothetical protein [Burkholderia latens]|uniref:Uncharacterized protein n=1 Tax=Burkholderia latens TaxID=488446 RepID=A0A6H9T8J6_9BURK|nr:hypothetical protein [Burkholderia latens]KAB0644157.1 hypothetical protein F7R21_03930 [Burkholderia latens]